MERAGGDFKGPELKAWLFGEKSEKENVSERQELEGPFIPKDEKVQISFQRQSQEEIVPETELTNKTEEPQTAEELPPRTGVTLPQRKRTEVDETKNKAEDKVLKKQAERIKDDKERTVIGALGRTALRTVAVAAILPPVVLTAVPVTVGLAFLEDLLGKEKIDSLLKTVDKKEVRGAQEDVIKLYDTMVSTTCKCFNSIVKSLQLDAVRNKRILNKGGIVQTSIDHFIPEDMRGRPLDGQEKKQVALKLAKDRPQLFNAIVSQIPDIEVNTDRYVGDPSKPISKFLNNNYGLDAAEVEITSPFDLTSGEIQKVTFKIPGETEEREGFLNPNDEKIYIERKAAMNADSFVTPTKQEGAQVLVLADGSGQGNDAVKAGKVSSAVAQEYIERNISGARNLQDVGRIMLDGLSKADSALRDDEEAGLCTLSEVALVEGADGIKYFMCASLGDSPALVLRGEGDNVTCIDPTEQRELGPSDPKEPGGFLGKAVSERRQTAEGFKRTHLGADLRNLQISIFKLQPRDRVVLTSDGLLECFDPSTYNDRIEETRAENEKREKVLPAALGFPEYPNWEKAKEAELEDPEIAAKIEHAKHDYMMKEFVKVIKDTKTDEEFFKTIEQKSKELTKPYKIDQYKKGFAEEGPKQDHQSFVLIHV